MVEVTLAVTVARAIYTALTVGAVVVTPNVIAPPNDENPRAVIGNNGGPPIDGPPGPQPPNAGHAIALGFGVKATADQLSKPGVSVNDGVVEGTFGALKNARISDAHHIIQNAAVKDITGYSRFDAPAIGLSGPSADPNSPHGMTRPAQRMNISGTYGLEKQIAADAMRAAGMSESQMASALARADSYFKGKLGMDDSTPTRTPGDRASPNENQTKNNDQ